jgi:hypothetical protein
VLFALLVMTGSVPVSIAALLHDGGDDACQPTVVAHDESAHRIGAARDTSTPAPQHCVVCHWSHSVQTLVTAAGFVTPKADSHRLTVSLVALAGAAALEQLAARAPPAIV